MKMDIKIKGFMESKNNKFLEETLQDISERYEYTIDDILGNKRNNDITMIRGLLIYILRLNGWVYKAIGKALNNRHHATIMYHYKKISGLVDIDYHPINRLERKVVREAREYYNQTNAA